MNEEIKPAEGEVKEPEQQAPEFTEIERRAMEMGWRPKQEFEGEEDDFIDAKEFVRRKPLFDKIEGQSKEIKNVRKALEALKQHYTKVQETEYNRALAKLQEARQEAISNADGVAFDQIDKEIRNVEKQMDVVKQAQELPLVEDEPKVHPEFAAWQNKNQWYTSVGYMRTWADEYGDKLVKQGMAPSEVLRKVEEGVRKEFPHKFTNPNKQNAPFVDNGKEGSKGAGRSEKIELTEQEERIMNTLVRSGTITKEKYLADLKAVKGIK
jgi:hypothetical protein